MVGSCQLRTRVRFHEKFLYLFLHFNILFVFCLQEHQTIPKKSCHWKNHHYTLQRKNMHDNFCHYLLFIGAIIFWMGKHLSMEKMTSGDLLFVFMERRNKVCFFGELGVDAVWLVCDWIGTKKVECSSFFCK